MADIRPDPSTASAEQQVVDEHQHVQEIRRRLQNAPDLVDLLQRLHEMRALLEPHFLGEEAQDGFFDLIRARASRHLGMVESFREDHVAFLSEIDRLAARVRECLAGPVAQVLDEARNFARRLDEHEARENNLLIDAMYNDSGQGD